MSATFGKRDRLAGAKLPTVPVADAKMDRLVPILVGVAILIAAVVIGVVPMSPGPAPVPAAPPVPFDATHPPSMGQKVWDLNDTTLEYSCPSEKCGAYGTTEYRVAEVVEEVQGDWARTSDYMTMDCEYGHTHKLVAIDDACTQDNGVDGGNAAQWVRLSAISATSPLDPADGLSGLQASVASSMDYMKYGSVFQRMTAKLVQSGQCSEDNIRYWGGWMRAVDYPDPRPYYQLYCGGTPERPNRIFLDASTGQIIAPFAGAPGS